MFDSFESTVGQRIRYYRMLAQMTQKELAETCGISEPAIRNYELGNRIPGIDTLGDIADALRVSYYALADPDLASLSGVMQTLFRLEYAYGIRPIEVDGTTMLQIDPKYTEQFAPYFQMALDRWLAEKKKLDSGEIGPGAYEDCLGLLLADVLGEGTGPEGAFGVILGQACRGGQHLAGLFGKIDTHRTSLRAE